MGASYYVQPSSGSGRAVLNRISISARNGAGGVYFQQAEPMKARTLIGVVLLIAGSAAAQAPKKWRTPWGDPDLQGSWSNATTTPLERPAKFNGREFLTEQERAAQDKDSTIATDK